MTTETIDLNLESVAVTLLDFFFFFSIYLAVLRSYLWHVGSSSLTRDLTQAPCIGSTESATGPSEKL